MYSRYYQNELQKLRDLAKEFAGAHPAAGPMLASESVDPDVERLLEGTAFLTGHLQQKIDDDFPEIIHGLMDVVFPHYLRPVPSVSIVSFTPGPSARESVKVPEGTFLAAEEKEGVKCMFKTVADVDVHPLSVVSASTYAMGNEFSITLSCQLTGLTLDQWKPGRIPFFLSGPYASASDLFGCLTRFLSGIKLVCPDAGLEYKLDKSGLKAFGLDTENSLFSYPANSFSGFSLFQEYFIFPQKFLFFELTGLENWERKGDGQRFDIVFEFDNPPFELPRVSRNNFSLFSVPVVNIFPHEADPAVVDHTKDKIKIRPSSKTGTGYDIYSVDRVTGFIQGSVQPVEYIPMDFYSSGSDNRSYFKMTRSVSPVTNTHEVYLSLAYSRYKPDPARETLSIELTCTNGSVPEKLMPGDIHLHTSNSPELLEFTNITAPTPSVPPPLDGDILWRLISHMSLNLSTLADTESIKQILQLYIFPESRDKAGVSANFKRIQGISGFHMENEDRLIRGMVVRGEKITMTVSKDHFASMGDVLIFGSLMDEFFSRYCGINSYSRLIVQETTSGESFSWEPRTGRRKLK